MTVCPHEPQIVRAFTADGEPPLAVELQQHLAECATCREAAAVASALRSELDIAWKEGAPTAEVVWFRAQLKARAEAAELAARPVFVAQALAGATVAGAVAAVIGMFGHFDILTLATRGLLLAFAVWLLLAPVAVYLATTED